MAIRKPNRAEARRLYVADALPIKVIAERLGVSERTVNNWKANDANSGQCWDKARTSRRMSHAVIEGETQRFLEDFLKLNREVLEEVKANTELSTVERVSAITSLTDAFTKGIKAASLTAPALNQLAIAGDVIQMLAAYVSEKHPDVAPVLVAVLEPFGVELAKKFG